MYLMKDKSFWQQTMQILRDREIFNEKVWLECVRHKDVKAIQEVLGQGHYGSRSLGLIGQFSSSLLL